MATYFFAPPLNTKPPVLVDNRYDTSSVETALTVHIDSNGDGTGAARGFTHIFIKAKGTIPANYRVEPTGGVLSIGNSSPKTVMLPADVTDSSEETRTLKVRGFYNHLDAWKYDPGKNPSTVPTAKTLIFTFTAGTEIVQLLILRSVVEIDDNGFSQIRWIARYGGLEQTSARGRDSVAPPVAGNRAKYDLILTAHKNVADDVSRALDDFFAVYPEFVFATEPTRFPEQVFRAKNKGQSTEIEYVSLYKGRGRRATFTVGEL